MGRDDRSALRPFQASLFPRCIVLDKREKNGEPLFWSRGNGWVMGGIVRVSRNCPQTHRSGRSTSRCSRRWRPDSPIQGKDGLWRPGLLDADAYPRPEISGSAFIAYAMAYGVNEGILHRGPYWPAVEKAWAGMLTHVYADGRLGVFNPSAPLPEPTQSQRAMSMAWRVSSCWLGDLSRSEVARFTYRRYA